jgi:hypothetical protein
LDGDDVCCAWDAEVTMPANPRQAHNPAANLIDNHRSFEGAPFIY